MGKLKGLLFSVVLVLICILLYGCSESQQEQKIIYVDETEQVDTIKVCGFAEYYHVMRDDNTVKTYFVGNFGIVDTVSIEVPVGDSVYIGAENSRGVEWQWVQIAQDSIYRFRTK